MFLFVFGLVCIQQSTDDELTDHMTNTGVIMAVMHKVKVEERLLC